MQNITAFESFGNSVTRLETGSCADLKTPERYRARERNTIQTTHAGLFCLNQPLGVVQGRGLREHQAAVPGSLETSAGRRHTPQANSGVPALRRLTAFWRSVPMCRHTGFGQNMNKSRALRGRLPY